jgi:hypothetical protein
MKELSEAQRLRNAKAERASAIARQGRAAARMQSKAVQSELAAGKVDVWRAMGPAAWAESEWVMEDGNPIVLAPWQMALAMSVR